MMTGLKARRKSKRRETTAMESRSWLIKVRIHEREKKGSSAALHWVSWIRCTARTNLQVDGVGQHRVCLLQYSSHESTK
jgi:hypothetical protein